MSLLAPLYFLGALAISLPILFHLIRRQPRGQVEFSSLMFLQPSPPRLTRRSRLDQWPLLLLRALVLLLLAAAFARPFVRSVALSQAQLPGRQLVLLIDTSASMQRAELWQQAKDKANDVIADLRPNDQLAIVTFDDRETTVLGFDAASSLSIDQLKTTARGVLDQLHPTWHPTDLGRAISFAGDLASNYEGAADPTGDDDEAASSNDGPSDGQSQAVVKGPAHLILISDLQSGSQVESLQTYPWPEDLKLDIRKVVPRKRTNASAIILEADPAETGESDRVRIRVMNSPDATESQFRIRWDLANQATPATGERRSNEERDNAGAADDQPSDGSDGSKAEATDSDAQGDTTVSQRSTHETTELPVQVPPGQSRIVRMPAPTSDIGALTLLGDDHPFDNKRYLVTPEPRQLTLLFVGKPSPDPRDSLDYYLQRVPLNRPTRRVTVEVVDHGSIPSSPDPETTPLIVIASAVSEPARASLQSYLENGGRVLVVLGDAAEGKGLEATINALTGDRLEIGEASVDDYAMFSRIDFSHPIFYPMADPKYNDFTKIRFWSHRSITGVDLPWKTVCYFDDGDPAIIQRPVGDGSLIVLASGWQPSASQLAMSTKFIPLVFSLFDSRQTAGIPLEYTLGESINLVPSPTATLSTPTGEKHPFRSPDDVAFVDRPGIYRYTDGNVNQTFAVNLAESESHTDPIGEDELERFGIVLGKNLSTNQELQVQRQLRDQELEKKQKIWQWLLLGALVLLGLETIIATMWSRLRSSDRSANPVPESTG